MMNFQGESQIMLRVFTEKWEENHTLCQANWLEHSLLLLKTIVKTFLPMNGLWWLVEYPRQFLPSLGLSFLDQKS
jgi:hypothetical protein